MIDSNYTMTSDSDKFAVWEDEISGDCMIWNKEHSILIPMGKDKLMAWQVCKQLNELLTIKKKSAKPTPLKDEIMEVLSDISEKEFDMGNKIKRQKEHIKNLETEIKCLKNDNRSLQRSYTNLSKDLEQIKGERDYYQKEYMKLRTGGF